MKKVIKKTKKMVKISQKEYPKVPRQYSLVKFNPDSQEYKYWKEHEEEMEKYPDCIEIQKDAPFIFFGECPQMPGHCILMGWKSHKMWTFWHTDMFIELTEDEV